MTCGNAAKYPSSAPTWVSRPCSSVFLFQRSSRAFAAFSGVCCFVSTFWSSSLSESRYAPPPLIVIGGAERGMMFANCPSGCGL